MKRIGALLILAAAIALVALSPGRQAKASSDFEVDAIFDTSKGIVPGQLVKIAGARVGTVKDVVLTPDFKARIEMTVDRRFAPFRSDAQCEIRPEGLISENFVQCDPGTPEHGELAAQGGHPPTVPTDHTALPVNLNDLFNIWRAPVNQRLQIILASFGAGFAGRGEDINDILRRANPTLTLVRRATRILNGQRAKLTELIRSADTVVSELATRRKGVADFIDRASRVTARTADHRTQLAQAIRRLPALLDAARPALTHLDEVAVNGTPVLSNLQAAAPGLNRVLGKVKPFVAAARPVIPHLSKASDQGRKTAKSATPVVALLRRFAHVALPVGHTADRFLVDARNRGAIDNLLLFAYGGAAFSALFDGVSHLPVPRGIIDECSIFANITIPSCNVNYGPGTAAAVRHRKARHKRSTSPLPTENAPNGQAQPSTPSLDSLLKPLQDLLPSLDRGIRLPGGSRSGNSTSGRTLSDLLDFLLK